MDGEMNYKVNDVVEYIKEVFNIEQSKIYDGLNKACEHGLNQNGELFDELMEHSSYFKKFGYSFEEMIQKMSQRVMSNSVANLMFNFNISKEETFDYIDRAYEVESEKRKEKENRTRLNLHFEHIADLAKEYEIRKYDAEGCSEKSFSLALNQLCEMENKEMFIDTGVLLFGTAFVDYYDLITQGGSLK